MQFVCRTLGVLLVVSLLLLLGWGKADAISRSAGEPRHDVQLVHPRMVARVELVDKQKRVIVFGKVQDSRANAQRCHSPLHPAGPRRRPYVLDWVEPGKTS